MRITPLDVRKQEFRKGMRGLDPEEVYAFLATVADEYEMALNDNKALRERLLELDDKVQEYRSMERTLRDTLLTAERVNVEAKDNARREANIIIKEAQIEAEKALRDIKTEAMKLRSQVSQLRSQRDSFLSRMKLLAESHLSYIGSAVEDFRGEDADVDAELSEEHLADKPVDRDDLELTRAPHHQFDSPARDMAPARTEPLPPRAEPVLRRQDTAREAPALAPDRPSVRRPQETTNRTDGIDPITMIIDRMKRGQQEILSSGAGAPGYPGTHSPVKEGNGNDVTRELSLDDLRREMTEEENVER